MVHDDSGGVRLADKTLLFMMLFGAKNAACYTTSMLENMTEALLAFDGERARSMDRQGPLELHTLNRTITEDAKRQAPQFGETATKTLVEAAAQSQQQSLWRH
jgi:hypothetical protein